MKKRTHGSVICAWVLVTALLLSVVHVPVQTHAAELTEIAVTFAEPKPGASASDVPDLSCSLPGCEFEWSGYSEVEGTETDFTGNFEANHAYLAVATLYLPKGDTLGDDCIITVNGTRLYRMMLDDRAELSVYMDMSYGDFSAVMLTYMFIPGSAGEGDSEGTTEVGTSDDAGVTTKTGTSGDANATTEIGTSGDADATTESAAGGSDASSETGMTGGSGTSADPAEIGEIAVTFPEPEPGASASDMPELSCSLPGCEFEWSGYSEVEGTETDFTGNFEANHAYFAVATLYLPKGDTLGDDCIITVNGTRLYRMMLDDRAELSVYMDMSYGDFTAVMLTYMFIPGSTGEGGSENSSTEAASGKADATTEVMTPGKADATTEVTTPGKMDATTEVTTPGKTDASTETATGSTGTTKEAAKTKSTATNPSDSKASLTVKASKSSLKRSKKKQTVKLSVSTNSSGKISYSAASNSKKLKKYISVSKKGVVTFKKNAPKGTYKIKVTVAAKDGFKSVSKTVKIKIK